MFLPRVCTLSTPRDRLRWCCWYRYPMPGWGFERACAFSGDEGMKLSCGGCGEEGGCANAAVGSGVESEQCRRAACCVVVCRSLDAAVAWRGRRHRRCLRQVERTAAACHSWMIRPCARFCACRTQSRYVRGSCLVASQWDAACDTPLAGWAADGNAGKGRGKSECDSAG